MSDGPDARKAERFAEFLRRLHAAPAAASFDEAFQQLGDILNTVEDEMTSIPFDPANWQSDSRMYLRRQTADERCLAGAVYGGSARRWAVRCRSVLAFRMGANGNWRFESGATETHRPRNSSVRAADRDRVVSLDRV